MTASKATSVFVRGSLLVALLLIIAGASLAGTLLAVFVCGWTTRDLVAWYMGESE